jgi:syntaxin 16
MASTSARNEPTTRSRTLLFLSYRDSAARTTTSRSSYRDSHDYGSGKGKGRAYDEDDENIALLERDSVAIDVDASLPPAWADLSDQVDDTLQRVRPKSELRSLSLRASAWQPGLTLALARSHRSRPLAREACPAGLYGPHSRGARDRSTHFGHHQGASTRSLRLR